MNLKEEAVPAAATVASYWDKFVGSHLNSPAHWESNEVVRQYQYRTITGDASLGPIDWFMKRFGPFTAMASICAGSGVLERHVARYLPPGGRIDGYDISPGSLEVARQQAAGIEGVHYHVADANIAVWEPSYLDAVFAHGALHHIHKLDHCLGQLRRALKPTGLLYVNDYVGPRRFQWTDVQLRIANELLEAMPARYRTGTVVKRCDPEALKALDPSEAVRADHITDHIHAHFEILLRVNRGGTILAPIFGSGCIAPEAFESAEGLAEINSLCEAEQRLLQSGVLPSNHVLIVGRARQS
jgi:SAM-dependent methyltransferase